MDLGQLDGSHRGDHSGHHLRDRAAQGVVFAGESHGQGTAQVVGGPAGIGEMDHEIFHPSLYPGALRVGPDHPGPHALGACDLRLKLNQAV